VDLTGYATETYVNDAIAAIPPVDLSAYATTDDVAFMDGQILTEAKDYVDGKLLDYETILNVDSKDADTLASANLYTDNAIAAIPGVDLTGYATETYVDDAIAAIPGVDLTGYATETYVNDAIAAIPPVDLSAYATTDDVAFMDGQILTEAKDYVDGKLLDYETILNVDSKDADTLASANLYTDQQIAIEDARIDDLEARLANVQTHVGDFNASPFKIHLVSGVSVITLPAPILNHTVTIKKTGADLATLEPHGTELIEGGANYLLTSTRQSATLVSDGTDWFII